MVGGTTHQQQQQQPASQLAPPPSSTTEEEEFLKRNTDCVYFLASPLTCKKGSECEYRHSDVARVNPRDCWYWLNGNCLNPKCGFRHPPLDGLLGTEVPTPKGPSVPQGPVTTMPKQGVACIFFQKGFCLKGHLCPFSHGPPYPVSNKAPQSGLANPPTEPPKMAFAGFEKSNQEHKVTQATNVPKPTEFLPPQGKQAPRMQAPPPARNGGGGAVEKKVPPPTVSEEPPRYRPASVVRNDVSAIRSSRGVYQTNETPLNGKGVYQTNDTPLNGKDADEYSREPTPGFDVLVDNELGESEYYPNEDQFGRSRGHEYEIGRAADYDVDRDMYGEQRYKERDPYAWEGHRASSERIAKRYPRDDSPDRFEESDLRHRISSKQRRGNNNGLRSVVSREHPRDSHADRLPRRDSHHHHHHRPDQGSLSSRLRGRIKIPGRPTSPVNENDSSRMERERQHRSRYSPQPSANHGRLRDRIKSRVSEDHNNERRDYRVSTEFTGPRRLSELKGYQEPINDGHSLGKRKQPSQQSEDNLSFEGPKPLSEILKRKRGGQATAPSTHVSSANDEDNNSKEPDPTAIEAEGADKQTGLVDLVDAEKEKPTDAQSSLIREENEVGLIDEDAMLDRELEAYDHKDGDYDYEQIDGEDYNMDEEGEYLDEDEYAKKESAVYS